VPIGFGPMELFIILAIVVVIFGAGRLTEVGSALGKGIRDFRRATREEDEPSARS
jgi:sec-independent protein translocase protein TatA